MALVKRIQAVFKQIQIAFNQIQMAFNQIEMTFKQIKMAFKQSQLVSGYLFALLPQVRRPRWIGIALNSNHIIFRG